MTHIKSAQNIFVRFLSLFLSLSLDATACLLVFHWRHPVTLSVLDEIESCRSRNFVGGPQVVFRPSSKCNSSCIHLLNIDYLRFPNGP